ncbi:MAG: alginate export family protein [Wenzhouxiangella sp.]
MTKFTTHLVCGALVFGALAASAAEDQWQTTIDVRYRVELVDVETMAKDATASTVRLRLGLVSPDWSGWSVGAMAHGNRAVLRERFNSTANGKTQYPVVADPDDEGLSQAWVRYRASERFRTTLGRQRIIEDNHRFIGNVGFRQLEQTFDAVTLDWQPAPGWQVNLNYLDKAHRVFGRSNPNALLAEADLDAWMGTLSRSLESATIAIYAHRLVFDDRPASHRNLGVRIIGSMPGEHGLEYRAEFARQAGLRELSNVSEQNYLHLRLGQRLDNWHWFAAHERLGGDREYAFQTPLATLHAHNGWTDQFLTTPAAGLIDTHLAAGARVGSWTGLVKIHDFRSDAGSRRFGNEYGIMVSRPLPAGLNVEAKLAHFDGRNAQADVSKLWLTLSGNW